MFNLNCPKMNKRILTVAVAALALSACSKNETVEVAGNQAIKFGNAFVNNSTRAMTEIADADSLKNFYVFGNYGSSEGTYNTTVFVNDDFTWSGGDVASGKEAYWQDESYYVFGAYSNGNEKLRNDEVAMSTSGAITFTNYGVTDKDLVMVDGVIDNTMNGTTGKAPVELTFKHLLSKVKFTFTSAFGSGYTVTVSNLKFNAAKTGSYANAAWTPGEGTADYTYNTLEFTASSTNEDEYSDECVVLPQSNENLEVTFTVAVTDGANPIQPKNFKGSLAYGETVKEWQPGYAYNYTLEIDGELMDQDENEIIEFKVVDVTGWVEANDEIVPEEVTE